MTLLASVQQILSALQAIPAAVTAAQTALSNFATFLNTNI